MPSDFLGAWQSCVGTRLDSIDTAIHKPAASGADSIIQIALKFGKKSISLGTAGGGGLQFSDLAPVTDMGDAGWIEHTRFASPAVGNQLRRVSRLLSNLPGPESEEPVGVALSFSAEELWIFNVADTLYAVNGRMVSSRLASSGSNRRSFLAVKGH